MYVFKPAFEEQKEQKDKTFEKQQYVYYSLCQMRTVSDANQRRSRKR